MNSGNSGNSGWSGGGGGGGGDRRNILSSAGGVMGLPKRDARKRYLPFCLGAMCNAIASNQVHLCVVGFLVKLL